MIITEKDGTALRNVVVGMIVSRSVLARMAAVWRPGLLGQPWADLVGGWCVDFYRSYKEPPKNRIRGLFQIWAEEAGDAENEKAVAAFLGGLSDWYDPKSFNAEYVTDLAGRVINRTRLLAVRNRLDAALASNNLEKAEAALVSPKVEIGDGAAVDVFSVPHLVKEAVLSRTKAEPLVTFPGALGTFTEVLFERDSLVAFQGADKVGKSYFLQEVSWQAVLQGRRVAFFSCGDLSETQMMRRLVTRAVGRPLRATKELEKVRIPTFLEKSESAANCVVTYDEQAYPHDVDWKDAWRTFRQIAVDQLGGEKDRLRLSTHSTGTLSVLGMRAILDRWQESGWTADLVVIDYADILAPPPGRLDSKEAIDANWAALRAYSIEAHNLVLTATQANAAAYSMETQTKGNFSGSKGKNAYATAIIAINQTPMEKDQGVWRLTLPVGRESPLNDQTCVHVAGCLGVACPIMLSIF